MPERSVFIRVAIKDGDRAIAELKKLGINGEKAIKRIEKATGPANKKLKQLDRTAAGSRKTFRSLGASISLIEGPLGGIAGRFNIFSAAIGRMGIAGALGVGALAALAAGFIQTSKVAGEAEQRLLRIEAVLNATGSASGLTLKQIDRMSDSLGQATLTTRNLAREAAAMLLTFKSIGGDTFQRTLRAAQDLSAVGFGDLRGSVKQLGKALEDPKIGLTALTRVGVSFTEAQKDLIKELVESGRLFEAQSLILAEIETQVGGAGAAEAGGLTGKIDSLGEAWSRLNEAIGNTALAQAGINALTVALEALRVGVAPTLEEDIAKQRAVLEAPLIPFVTTVGDKLIAQSRLGALLRQQAAENIAELEAQELAAAGREKQLAQVRTDALFRIEKDLDKRILALRENRVRKIQVAIAKDIKRIEAQRTPATAADVDRLVAKARDLETRAISQATEAERKRAQAADLANRKVVEGLDNRLDKQRALLALAKTKTGATASDRAAAVALAREAAVQVSLARLSKTATAAQRKETERLTIAFVDTKLALEEYNAETRKKKALDTEAKSLIKGLRNEEEQRNVVLARANFLLAAGALNAKELAFVQKRLAEEAAGTADIMEDLGQSIAGPFVEGITQAKGFVEILGSVESAILRVANTAIENSLAKIFTATFEGKAGGLGDLFSFGSSTPTSGAAGGSFRGAQDAGLGGGFFSFLGGFADFITSIFHKGAAVGHSGQTRRVPAIAFAGAPHLQRGTIPGLHPDEVAGIFHRREIVLNPQQSDAVRRGQRDRAPGRGGSRVSIESLSINVDGGDFGADPAFTGDQVARGFMETLDMLTRER